MTADGLPAVRWALAMVLLAEARTLSCPLKQNCFCVENLPKKIRNQISQKQPYQLPPASVRTHWLPSTTTFWQLQTTRDSGLLNACSYVSAFFALHYTTASVQLPSWDLILFCADLHCWLPMQVPFSHLWGGVLELWICYWLFYDLLKCVPILLHIL